MWHSFLYLTFRDNANFQSGLNKLEIQLSAQFDDHGCTVWRVCWNITGTILASSGDDGCVRMFKSKLHHTFIFIFFNAEYFQ